MYIRLKNIRVFAYHGVYEHEREQGGYFEIDVELSADLQTAAVSDSIEDTIDYTEVQKIVIETTTVKKHHLLESLSDAIASRILAAFNAEEVIVRIRKPGSAVGGALDYVEIECHKSRS